MRRTFIRACSTVSTTTPRRALTKRRQGWPGSARSISSMPACASRPDSRLIDYREVPMLILRLIPIALLALTCDADAGSPEADTGQVRARLIASVDAVRPGDTIQVGVHQS